MDPAAFFEEDEPVERVAAAFGRGEPFVTCPPADGDFVVWASESLGWARATFEAQAETWPGPEGQPGQG